jgi:hypothetical protein
MPRWSPEGRRVWLVNHSSRSGFQLRIATVLNLPTLEPLSTELIDNLSRILDRGPPRFPLGGCVPLHVGAIYDPHPRVDLHALDDASLDQLQDATARHAQSLCGLANCHPVDRCAHDHARNHTKVGMILNTKKH